MSNSIFVGNLSYNATAQDIGFIKISCAYIVIFYYFFCFVDVGKFFEQIGPVANASIVSRNGRSLGFGFVSLKDEAIVNQAVQALNGKDLLGRPIKV
jgi:RNA recognition motif-containing protein